MLDLEMQDFHAGKMGRSASLIGDPARWALFLDIDGTLLDVAPTPDAVAVPPGLVRTLEHLVREFAGAVAVITGRRVSAADRLFAPLKLVTSGVHGTEVRAVAGGEQRMLAPPTPSDLVHEVSGVTRMSSGILVEQKGAGLSVHYRNAPEARMALEAELGQIVDRWPAFELRPGRKVLEVLPQGFSKGTALAWQMRLPPFQGRVPLMIGDDRGDEPALAAAARLGGVALKVAGEHFAGSAANFDAAAGVRAWLSMLVRKLELRRAARQD